MSHRLTLGPLIAMLWLTLAIGGCAGLNRSEPDDPHVAVLLIQLDENDHRAAPAAALKRSWVSTWLVPPGQPAAQARSPVELHIRLRREGSDPEQPSHEHVLPLDGSQFTFDLDDAQPRPITVRVDRPGGSFVFSGGNVGEQNDRTVYGGPVVVRFHPGFQAAASSLEGSVTVLDLMRAALLGLDPADLRRYAAAHVTLTLGDAIELAQQQITASDVQLLEEVGYRLIPPQLLAMRAGGVTVSEAAAFRRGGFQLNVEDLTRLTNAGLTPAYAVAMKTAGFGHDARHLLQLHADDISPAYAARLRQLIPSLTHAQLRQLAQVGVDPEALAAFQKAGYQPSVGQIIRMHEHHVSADDVLLLREVGYDFSLNELVTLAWRDVPTGFTISLLQDGFEPLSAEQIVNLHQRDVTPAMVRLLREQDRAVLARTGSEPVTPDTPQDAEATSESSDRPSDAELEALIDVLGDT
ncbi:MAG: hypothetical protein WDZ31_07065, partial [Phycisphaeraceae bacterium]